VPPLHLTLTGTALAANPASAQAPPASSDPSPSPSTLANYKASLLDSAGKVEQQVTVIAQHNPTVAKSGTAQKVTDAKQQIQGLNDKQLTTLYQATGNTTAVSALPSTLSAVAQDVTKSAPLKPNINAAPNVVTLPDCGSAPDPVAVHDAQIAISSAQLALAIIPQAIVAGAIVLGEGAVVTVPDPIYAVAAAVLNAAQVVLDDQQFKIDQQSNCQDGAHQQLLVDVANNLASDTTNLLSAIGGLSALVDGRTNTIITKSDAVNQLVDSRTNTIITKSDALNQLVDSRTNTIITKTDALTQLVDGRTNTLIGQIDLALKLSIQQALVDQNQNGIATFEVPARAGGYLDAQPIGVQSLVTDTLAKMQAAGQPVGADAARALSDGNSALAAKAYKDAYRLYQEAYQAMVK